MIIFYNEKSAVSSEITDEREKAEVWKLSEREKQIIKNLG